MIEMGMWEGKERRKPRIYDGTYLTLKNLSNQINNTVEKIEKTDLREF
jgi:hypothetical protein